MGIELDKDAITPSDFCCIVTGLPLDKTQDELKESFEKHFATYNIEIAYINYAYNVEEMVKYTNELKKALHRKGLYKLKRKNFCSEKKIDYKEVKQKPELFDDPPTIREGICKVITLDLNELENQIYQIEQKLLDYE